MIVEAVLILPKVKGILEPGLGDLRPRPRTGHRRRRGSARDLRTNGPSQRTVLMSHREGLSSSRSSELSVPKEFGEGS